MFSPTSWPWGCYQTYQYFCQKETWQNDKLLPKISQSQPQIKEHKSSMEEAEMRNADGPVWPALGLRANTAMISAHALGSS